MEEPVCLLFSGQGTQEPGMCAGLWDHPAARETLEHLVPHLGEDLERLTTAAGEEELALTANAQRALHAHHMGHWSVFRAAHPETPVRGALGHSVGVVAALTAAEALTLEDSARFIRERARAFSQTCSGLDRPGGLAAVAADSLDDVAELAARVEGVEVALRNTAFKCAVAGDLEALEDFAGRARARGMRVTPLKVQGPYHSRAFARCSEILRETLRSIPIRAPKFPVFMGTSGAEESDPARIRMLLAEQASLPELHLEAVWAAYDSGCRAFLELGSRPRVAGWLGEQLIGQDGLPLSDVTLAGRSALAGG